MSRPSFLPMIPPVLDPIQHYILATMPIVPISRQHAVASILSPPAHVALPIHTSHLRIDHL